LALDAVRGADLIAGRTAIEAEGPVRRGGVDDFGAVVQRVRRGWEPRIPRLSSIRRDYDSRPAGCLSPRTEHLKPCPLMLDPPTGSRDQQLVVAARIGNRAHTNKLALVAGL